MDLDSGPKLDPGSASNYKTIEEVNMKGKKEKYTLGPRYLSVPVLMNTGTFLVYQLLPGNMIFTFFQMYNPESHNTGMQKWSTFSQFLCASIWDLKVHFF